MNAGVCLVNAYYFVHMETSQNLVVAMNVEMELSKLREIKENKNFIG